MAKEVMVEISARHLHVSQKDLEILFGEGYTLTPKKDLSQPGQFACEEKVTIVGEKGQLKASILGPVRPETQVEISLTDARAIGALAPIRESGDVAASGACTISVGDKKVECAEGVIVAKRHIHFTPADAAAFGVADKEIVKVRVEGERALIFDEVVVRVSEKFAAAMHIDTDESNAACAAPGTMGVLVD